VDRQVCVTKRIEITIVMIRKCNVALNSDLAVSAVSHRALEVKIYFSKFRQILLVYRVVPSLR